MDNYIKRDLEEMIIAASKEYSCILITGARQVGKSTILEQLMKNEREEVSLDDMVERKLASTDVGISNDTATRWLKILEKSDIIFFMRPYSNNLLKRTVKTPKVYFFDTGLVSYLTRYFSPEILAITVQRKVVEATYDL